LNAPSNAGPGAPEVFNCVSLPSTTKFTNMVGVLDSNRTDGQEFEALSSYLH
jgi:hypothetical protein